jgi:putative peptidoglycan lipid II flippase
VSSPTTQRVLAMASGTAASRFTGLLRVLVVAWVLGFSPLADAFNVANTVPNMLFDIVLGGVLGATFIPVFVERLAHDGERRAWRSISSVISAALVLLVVATAVTWLCAPWIIDGFTFLQHTGPRQHEREVATSFLRWFAPQIFFYGVIGITTALLNIRNKFAIGSWAPVANNVVCVAVLVWFHLVAPAPTVTSVAHAGSLVWLGLGTTAGVAVQFLITVPALDSHDLARLRFRLDLADPAVRAVARLGGWTLGVVVANQASLFVVLALAFSIGGRGPVSAYTYGWSFMQMPYAVVVVSVLGAVTPELARRATSGDREGLRQTLAGALRQSLVIILPCAVGLMILAQPLVGLLLNHGHLDRSLLAGTVLAVLAAGLPGFTVFQLCVRGLQSMQRARDVFFLYLVENVLTVALAIVLGRHAMAGLSASISLAYTLSAGLAVVVLARQQVGLAGTLIAAPVRRTLLATLVMGVLVAMVFASVSWHSGPGLIVRTGASAVVGVTAFGLIAIVGPRRRSATSHV